MDSSDKNVSEFDEEQALGGEASVPIPGEHTRQSRFSLGGLMAKLPDWANDRSEDGLRAIAHELEVNSSGVDVVLCARIRR